MIIAGEDKIITNIKKKIKNKFKESNCGPVRIYIRNKSRKRK